MTTRPDPFTTYDAAYVLGALTEADRAAYERHLPSCADCRAAIERFRSMPRLLAKVESAASAAGTSDRPAPSVPDTLLPGLVSKARRSTRRRRIAAGAVAATVALGLVGGTAAVVGQGSSAPGGEQVALSKAAAVPLQASLQVRPTDWGSELTMKCRYSGYVAPDGTSYELVVVPTAGGEPQTVARWSVIPGREATVVGSTELTPAQIAQVQVRTSDGQILLRS